MTDECADCGGDVYDSFVLPPSWFHYLREQRGMEPGISTKRVPFCRACFRNADYLREYESHVDDLGDDGKLERRTRDLLERLDLDALEDPGFPP